MKNDSLASEMFAIGLSALRPSVNRSAEIEDLARDAMQPEPLMSEADVDAFAASRGE